MTQNTRIFERLEFYGVEKALADCQNAGYTAAFMPELIDQRISAEVNSPLLRNWFTTPSVRITGKTGQGAPVVVYAHVDNYLSNPANLKIAREQGLQNGAGRVPQAEFQRLVDLEDGQTVFVVDYKTLRKSSFDVTPVSKALKHPQTIPFLGGQDRAECYLEKHRQVYGDNIGIWHSDDLADSPRGRVLFVGSSYDNGLSGNSGLDGGGRFLGVAPEAQSGVREAPRKEGILAPTPIVVAPTLEQMLTIVNNPDLNPKFDSLLII